MKKIVKKVESCSDCPYLRYDPDYGKSYDSGYNCDKKDRRIIDDYDYSNPNNPTRLTLTTHKIPIPEWCPLEDVDDD